MFDPVGDINVRNSLLIQSRNPWIALGQAQDEQVLGELLRFNLY